MGSKRSPDAKGKGKRIKPREMARRPNLTGDVAIDQALMDLAKILAEISRNAPHAADPNSFTQSDDESSPQL
jgi:hypothetical protein